MSRYPDETVVLKIDIDTYIKLIIIISMFLVFIVFTQGMAGDTDVVNSTVFSETTTTIQAELPAPPTNILGHSRPKRPGAKPSRDRRGGRGIRAPRSL